MWQFVMENCPAVGLRFSIGQFLDLQVRRQTDRLYIWSPFSPIWMQKLE